MPYYCTVPRCTSMAGKVKNVSFHQFPRDDELAKLWNKILKRGKPYTKYSKVCSLHFKPEDYTITSVGKNKGQWRTLRKDAIPSQNLPSDSPVPYQRHRNTEAWVPSDGTPMLDPQLQQKMAQAIYMQTMIAMQVAGVTEPAAPVSNGLQIKEESASSSNETQDNETKSSYKCEECSKCFKDPDVFILHQRTHTKNKENFNSNKQTLKSNPILTNLLKSQGNENFYVQNNILSIETQIMAALAVNMENYIRNLILTQGNGSEQNNVSDCEELNESTENKLILDETV